MKQKKKTQNRTQLPHFYISLGTTWPMIHSISQKYHNYGGLGSQTDSLRKRPFRKSSENKKTEFLKEEITKVFKHSLIYFFSIRRYPSTLPKNLAFFFREKKFHLIPPAIWKEFFLQFFVDLYEILKINITRVSLFTYNFSTMNLLSLLYLSFLTLMPNHQFFE